MIDLHCHLLPGIDDGPKDLDGSVEMARLAAADGVQVVVATPHGSLWGYEGDQAETQGRVAVLREALSRNGVNLNVLTGLEVYLTPDTAAHCESGRVFTLNGTRYILVEFSFDTFPAYTEQSLFDLQMRQLIPIIAHPERNSVLAAHPDILERLVERGMLAQVTAGSLVGYFGKHVKAVAETMVTRRLVHVLASDGHPVRGREPVLSRATDRVAELIGREAAEAMVSGLPAAIIRDEVVEVPSPMEISRRSWFPFGRK